VRSNALTSVIPSRRELNLFAARRTVYRLERCAIRGLWSEQSPCFSLDSGDRAASCERGTTRIERGTTRIERPAARTHGCIQRRTQRLDWR
jgi:hypothetical protein